MTVYCRILRLADTDAAGVVYFASLLSICHEAYEFILEQQGLPLQQFLENTEIILPIAHAEIDFFAPLKCGDRLSIETELKLINQFCFECDYQVRRVEKTNQSERPAAKAITRHVCINAKTRQ
ncbi:MAG: acyl-CoA thioesterase, partial [Microcystaceae cyanobacterium]